MEWFHATVLIIVSASNTIPSSTTGTEQWHEWHLNSGAEWHDGRSNTIPSSTTGTEQMA